MVFFLLFRLSYSVDIKSAYFLTCICFDPTLVLKVDFVIPIGVPISHLFAHFVRREAVVFHRLQPCHRCGEP